MFPNQYRVFYLNTDSYSISNLVKGRLFPSVTNPGTGTLFNINRYFVTLRNQPEVQKNVLLKSKTVEEEPEKKETKKIETAEGDGLGISNTDFGYIPISKTELTKMKKNHGLEEKSDIEISEEDSTKEKKKKKKKKKKKRKNSIDMQNDNKGSKPPKNKKSKKESGFNFNII